MSKLIDKSGNEIPTGSVIFWHVWDSDDFVTWCFIGVVRADYVTYLGGGIDFGAGIGQSINHEEVMQQSEDNDDDDKGIQVIGKQNSIPDLLKQGFTQMMMMEKEL